MSTPTIQTICEKYSELKDLSRYRDITSIYGKENKVVGYYLIYMIATKLNGFFIPY